MSAAGQDRAAVDAPIAIVAASYLIGVNQLIVNLQPLILGALAEAYRFNDRQLGYVSAVFIGFNTIAVISAPVWVRIANWRILSGALVALAAIALAAGASLSSLASLLTLFAVLGGLKGALGAPAFASLGDTANPDRSYAASLIVQSLLAAAAAVPVAQWIIPQHGVAGLFLTLSAVVATGLAAAWFLPDAGARIEAVAGAGAGALLSRDRLAPVLGLVALGVFVCGILAFWYFVERIGAARGVPKGLIGATVSLCALATVGTAGLVAWLGGRVATLWFVIGGVVVVIAGYACLTLQTDLAFVATAVLFAMGWGLAQPGYWTVIRKVDASGRLFVAAPAASGLAGVLTGVLAGPVIEQGGYAGLILSSAALLIASAAILVVAERIGAGAAQRSHLR